jgi:hypothetical protein
LLNFASRAPKRPSRIDSAIEPRIIALRQWHPSWGKQRVADELTQANQWVPLVSRGTVRRILREAGLWPEPETSVKKEGLTFVSRTAEQIGQTLNVDLYFVPADLPVVLTLPTVSGSSELVPCALQGDEQHSVDILAIIT